jgi:hypothetical protein
MRSSSQGFELAADVDPAPGVTPLTLGDRMFIVDGTGGLWVTDGTPAGTRHLSDAASSEYPLTAYRGLVYLSALTLNTERSCGARTARKPVRSWRPTSILGLFFLS